MQPQCFLIDDDADDRDVFLLAIKEIDSRISCEMTDDPVEAIMRFRENGLLRPDFLFLDVNMPKMNGLQALQELNKIPDLATTKIWMYSTSDAGNIASRCREAGAAGFLVKPYHVDELIGALRRILSPIIPPNGQ